MEKAFQALGDPTRRAIFERLFRGPQAVVEISTGSKVSRPAVSQHLKILRKAGLVLVHQQGTRRFYQVNPAGVEAMRDYLDQTWSRALEVFKQHAEKERTKS